MEEMMLDSFRALFGEVERADGGVRCSMMKGKTRRIWSLSLCFMTEKSATVTSAYQTSIDTVLAETRV